MVEARKHLTSRAVGICRHGRSGVRLGAAVTLLAANLDMHGADKFLLLSSMARRTIHWICDRGGGSRGDNRENHDGNEPALPPHFSFATRRLPAAR